MPSYQNLFPPISLAPGDGFMQPTRNIAERWRRFRNICGGHFLTGTGMFSRDNISTFLMWGGTTSRPEELRLEPWWPRWISIDWRFQHPSAVYWHCAVPAGNPVRAPWAGPRWETSGEVVRAAQAGDESASGPRIVTSKSLSKSNYVRHTRELAKQKARQT